MALDLQHFEFEFPTTVLTKALRTYRKGSWSKLATHDKRSEYLVAGETVSFLKQKKKILDVHCSCSKSLACYHLAVALFAQEELATDTNVSLGKPMTNAGAKAVNKQYMAVQRLLRLGKSVRPPAELKAIAFPLLLAYYVQLYAMFDEPKEAEELKRKLEKEILHRFQEGLDAAGIQNLLAACRLSLRSEKSRAAMTWSFLIGLLVNFKIAADELKELQSLLLRRSQRSFHQTDLNYREISALQLQLAFAWPEKKIWKTLEGPESLALAHFLVVSGHVKKGLLLLKNHILYQKTLRKRPEPGLITFAIEKSVQSKDEKMEAFFIEEQIRYALQVDPALLERLRDLMDSTTYLVVVLKLAEHTPVEWVEKKKDLLLASGDRKAMQAFLKKGLRFNSILQVLSAILPLVPANCTSLLVSAIPAALRESPRREWQEHILSQCQPYLSKLPDTQRQEIVRKVVAAMGERSHVSDWFNEVV